MPQYFLILIFTNIVIFMNMMLIKYKQCNNLYLFCFWYFFGSSCYQDNNTARIHSETLKNEIWLKSVNKTINSLILEARQDSTSHAWTLDWKSYIRIKQSKLEHLWINFFLKHLVFQNNHKTHQDRTAMKCWSKVMCVDGEG